MRARHATKLWKNPNALTQRADRSARIFLRIEAAIFFDDVRTRGCKNRLAKFVARTVFWFLPARRARIENGRRGSPQRWRCAASQVLPDGADRHLGRAETCTCVHHGCAVRVLWRTPAAPCHGFDHACSGAARCVSFPPLGDPIGAAGRVEIRREKVAVKKFYRDESMHCDFVKRVSVSRAAQDDDAVRTCADPARAARRSAAAGLKTNARRACGQRRIDLSAGAATRLRIAVFPAARALKIRAGALFSNRKISSARSARAQKNACEKMCRAAAKRAQKRARCVHRHGVLKEGLCALGAFRVKKIRRICVNQLRSDKDFVYFT